MNTEQFNERAAIYEFEAGFPRQEAERMAKVEMWALKNKAALDNKKRLQNEKIERMKNGKA